jgi:hypothetical protein
MSGATGPTCGGLRLREVVPIGGFWLPPLNGELGI